MPPNLRASLTAFSIGFAVEGAGALYSVATNSVNLPGGRWLLYLGAGFTVVGLVFLFLGRHEWSEVHRQRVRHAHTAFFITLATAVLTGAVVGAYVYLVPGAAAPSSLGGIVAAAVAVVFVGSYVTYVLVVFHLVTLPGRIAAVGAVVWTAFVADLLATAVAAQFPAYLAFLRQQGGLSAANISPLTRPLSLLFIAYFLLLVAYVDAHHRVAKGLDPSVAPAQPPA